MTQHTPGPSSSSVQFGNTKVQIVRGSLPHFQQAKVLVCSGPKSLQLTNAGMAEQMLKIAGKNLQSSCDNKYPDGIDFGELAVTRGFNLKCDFVYHGALEDYSTDHIKAIKNLEDFMQQCLDEAETHNTSSIAFPTLGTGSLNFPPNVSARCMFNSIQNFQTNNTGTALHEVYIIVYDKVNGWQAVEKVSFIQYSA